jgi:hypothetical protein
LREGKGAGLKTTSVGPQPERGAVEVEGVDGPEPAHYQRLQRGDEFAPTVEESDSLPAAQPLERPGDEEIDTCCVDVEGQYPAAVEIVDDHVGAVSARVGDDRVEVDDPG